MSDRDTLFAVPRDATPFRFDEHVAAVFGDMIERSVPGYGLVVELAAGIAARHVRDGGLCMDLGCSLGATSWALASALTARNVRIVGIDNAPAMLERARTRFQTHTFPSAPHFEWRCADLRDVDVTAAQALLATFTLQFVPARDRLGLLRRWCTTMDPQGVLVYAEKLARDDPASPTDSLSRALSVDGWDEARHLDFKRARGYSELEIAQKRAALDDVLVPDTATMHLERLRDAGFNTARCWFRCLNWAAFVASPGPLRE